MSRRPRIKLDRTNAFYHVMARTAQQEFYFKESVTPGFKEVMIDIFKKMSEVYYVRIFAWVVMDNHYHLCLEVQKPPKNTEDIKRRFKHLQSCNNSPRRWQPELSDSYYERFTDLSQFMSSVNSRIARAFNRIRGTKGHLWGDRYRSKVIENESNLIKVMCYVEHNPVKAGLCKVPSAYPWCSAGQLRKRASQGKKADLPAIDFLRTVSPEDRAHNYVEWIDEIANQLYCPPTAPASNPKYQLSNEQLKIWTHQFDAAEPEDWSSQAFGSPAFHRKIALEEQAKTRHMTKQRSQEVKRRRVNSFMATRLSTIKTQ